MACSYPPFDDDGFGEDPNGYLDEDNLIVDSEDWDMWPTCPANPLLPPSALFLAVQNGRFEEAKRLFEATTDRSSLLETIFKIPEPDLPTSPSSSFSSPLSTPSLPHPPIPTAALTATPASPSLYEDGERRGGERGEREDREVEETSVASAQSPQRTTKASIISTSTSSSSSSSTTTTSNSTTSNSNSSLTIEDSSTSQHTLLSVAISQGHKAMAEWLVESGAPLSSSTPRSDPLLTAIRRGDVAAVEMLLDAFVARDLPVPVALFFHDPITEEPAAATEVILALVEHPSFVENLHSIVSRSPSRIVLSAVKRGSLRLMQRLFAHPLITPTSVSFSGILARAVRLRCHDIVQHLLSLGAPLPVTDSLLCAAVRNDDAAMARLILGEQGPQQPNANAASVLSVPNGPGSASISNASGTARLPTPLSLACEHRCSAEMFTLLLSICKDSPPPPSLLHAAIKAGCGTEVVLLLINHGAPFDTAPYPLLTASEAGSFETVRILLGAGADPVRCNLIHTAAGAGQVELVRLLIERGCPCDVPAADHTTPLYKAVLKGNCEVVKLLVEAGASRGFVMNGGFSLMYAAAEFGYLEIVELLFSLGCAFDLPNSIDGATPLYMAAQNGHLEIAKRLIEAGANTQVLFKESHSLLYVAAEHGRTKMIRYLLGAPGNADPNRASQDGSTPLYAAVKSRHPKVVRILIEAGADINHLNASGLSPIFVAAERGFTELVKLLLEKGASGFDVPNVVDGATPLYVAVLNGHLEVVELLVKAGASLTVVQTSSGFDLVFAAADANHKQLLRYLLSLGCSPNTVARNSYTPLYAAVKKHLWEVAEILLDGGANPNYSLPSSGFTPMYIAAEIGRTKFVRKLLGVGAEADLPNTIDQATPVYIAAQNGHLKIVKLLLAAGANQNITLRGGYNMVYVSAQFGRSDVCEHLVELGVPFDHPCEVSSTPLYMAVRNGHLSIAEFLLEKGANKNVIHRDGFSLMYLACERGYYSFAKRLLRLGALYDVPNLKDGATPLYMATQHGYMKLVKLLLARGALKTVTLTGGFTLMYTASEYGHTALVEYLLSIGCAVDAPNNIDGATPLYIAAERGHWEILQHLIDGGARVDATLSGFRSAFGAACSNGHRRAAEVLLEAGAQLVLGKFDPLKDIKYYSSSIISLLTTVKYNLACRSLSLQQRCWLSTIIHFLDTAFLDPSLVDFYNSWLMGEASDFELIVVGQDILRNIQNPSSSSSNSSSPPQNQDRPLLSDDLLQDLQQPQHEEEFEDGQQQPVQDQQPGQPIPPP